MKRLFIFILLFYVIIQKWQDHISFFKKQKH